MENLPEAASTEQLTGRIAVVREGIGVGGREREGKEEAGGRGDNDQARCGRVYKAPGCNRMRRSRRCWE